MKYTKNQILNLFLFILFVIGIGLVISFFLDFEKIKTKDQDYDEKKKMQKIKGGVGAVLLFGSMFIAIFKSDIAEERNRYMTIRP